jgi:Tfp pilus assembly PilM family ATPase
MALINPLNQAFGLDIGDRSFKLAQVVKTGNKQKPYRMTAWGSIDVPEGVLERGEVMDADKAAKLLTELVHKSSGRLKGKAVVACLPEARSFVKNIELDRTTSHAAIAKAVAKEIEQNIPLPIDEIYYDWHLVEEPNEDPEGSKPGKKQKRGQETSLETGSNEPTGAAGSGDDSGEVSTEDDDGTEPDDQPGLQTDELDADLAGSKDAVSNQPLRVLLAAAPKKLVEDYVTVITQAGLAPIALEIEATAIARAVVPIEQQPDAPIGILDIGATRSSLIVVDDGAMQMSISIPLSGIELTETIARELSITEADAELVKIECGLDAHRCEDKMWNILLPMIDDMSNKIRNSLRFYRIGFPTGKKIEKMYLCGGGAHFRDIDNVLSRKLTIKVRRGDTLVNINRLPKGFSQESALSYTTALGLALRASDEKDRFRHSFRL